MSKIIFKPLVALWLLSFFALPVNGINLDKDYKFHSVFVYNFTKYIQWPVSTSETRIAILSGGKSIMESFNKMAELKSSATQKFIIQNISSVNDAYDCHILFVPEDQSDQLEAIAAKLADKPVLIITEESGIIKKGSCINFITVDGKLNIELNREAVDKAGLKVSGQLLALAILV
ncbi:MAG: YfiR family protein [Candidatus Cyclobacteriaceae bacterium M3_2C_046]